MATLSRRTSKREEVEREVLRVTEELLAGGALFAELSIERIAREAGISRPAFYFYFRDKRELLMRLTEGVADLFYAEADRWWSGAGDGRATLREAVERVVDIYCEHAPLLRAVVEAAAYDEAVGQFWRELLGRFVEANRVRIEQEREDGRTDRDLEAEATAFQLCWMTERACYQRLVQGGDLREPAFLSALVGLWERGVYGRLPAD